MKALKFSRKPAKYVAAGLAGKLAPGKGASVGPIKLVDMDEPELPAQDWVRLRPRLAGICGSDLATIDGYSSRYFEPIVSFPFVPGHEVVGDLEDGTRAVLIPVLSCVTRGISPICRSCETGQTNRCGRIAYGHLEPGLQTGYCADTGGGWSGELVAHPSQILPIPESLTDEQAVMIEPTACAVHGARAVLSGAADKPANIALIGSGTLGLLTLAALRAQGSEAHIIVTGKYPHQKALATSLGADKVVSPRELGRAVRSRVGAWVMDDSSPHEGQLSDGMDVVVDCVGSEASLTQALQVVAPGGRIVVIGMPGHTSLDLTSLWHRETSITGCYAYTRSDFEAAINLVSSADLGRLVSATYPLSRYEEAIDHAANAGTRGAVKIAFDLRKKDRR